MAYENRDLVRDQELKVKINTPELQNILHLANGRQKNTVAYLVLMEGVRKILNGEWDVSHLGLEVEGRKAVLTSH